MIHRVEHDIKYVFAPETNKRIETRCRFFFRRAASGLPARLMLVVCMESFLNRHSRVYVCLGICMFLIAAGAFGLTLSLSLLITIAVAVAFAIVIATVAFFIHKMRHSLI